MRDERIRILLLDGAAYAVAISGRNLVEQARRTHDLSPVNTAALGRMMMAAMLLASDIKDEGLDVTLTFHGDGPSGRATAVAAPDGGVRGYIDYPQVDLPPRQSDGKLDVRGALGSHGRLTVIRDTGDQPYIGQVPLVSGEVAEDVAYYYALSEQKPCLIYLGVMVDVDHSVKAASGMGIFPLPGCSEDVLQQLEGRMGIVQMMTRMMAGGADIDQCLQVVFEGLQPGITERVEARYHCPCARERMEAALISLGREEMQKIIDEDGQAEIVCHFCRKAYRFSRDELTSLLANV